MTDISARQTFANAGNPRFSDDPGTADTPESGRYIEAPGLTRPTGLLADRRNCVTMGRRKARPRGRENYPRQTNHIRAIRPPPGSPRVEFGASFAPSPALLRRFFRPRPRHPPPPPISHSTLRTPLTARANPARTSCSPRGRPIPRQPHARPSRRFISRHFQVARNRNRRTVEENCSKFRNFTPLWRRLELSLSRFRARVAALDFSSTAMSSPPRRTAQKRPQRRSPSKPTCPLRFPRPSPRERSRGSHAFSGRHSRNFTAEKWRPSSANLRPAWVKARGPTAHQRSNHRLVCAFAPSIARRRRQASSASRSASTALRYSSIRRTSSSKLRKRSRAVTSIINQPSSRSPLSR